MGISDFQKWWENPQQLDGLFVRQKIPSFEMDDD